VTERWAPWRSEGSGSSDKSDLQREQPFVDITYSRQRRGSVTAGKAFLIFGLISRLIAHVHECVRKRNEALKQHWSHRLRNPESLVKSRSVEGGRSKRATTVTLKQNKHSTKLWITQTSLRRSVDWVCAWQSSEGASPQSLQLHKNLQLPRNRIQWHQIGLLDHKNCKGHIR
jgi:hypothetical protein